MGEPGPHLATVTGHGFVLNDPTRFTYNTRQDDPYVDRPNSAARFKTPCLPRRSAVLVQAVTHSLQGWLLCPRPLIFITRWHTRRRALALLRRRRHH